MNILNVFQITQIRKSAVRYSLGACLVTERETVPQISCPGGCPRVSNYCMSAEGDFICLSGGIGGEPLNLTNCWKLQTCTRSCLDALGTSGCDLGRKAPLQNLKPHLPPQLIAILSPCPEEERRCSLTLGAGWGVFAPCQRDARRCLTLSVPQ